MEAVSESVNVKIEPSEHEDDEIKDTPDFVDPLSLADVKPEFYCTTCHEKFDHKLSLEIHEMLHDENCFCFLCKVNYKPKNFPTHVKKMHMDMVCNLCNKVFCFKKAFKLHHNTHTREIIYKCDQCDKSFMQRGSLRTHQYSAHEGRKLKCKICDGTFITSSSLNRHLRNMHSKEEILYCRICLEEFPDKKSRNDHEVDHTKSKVCKECGVKFSKISVLTKHLTSTHFRTEKCEYCQKLFHALKLQAHITAAHTARECKDCNKVFYNNRNFMNHCRSHTNKTVTCEICGKKFKELFMKRHLQLHKQNKLEKCNLCHKFLRDMERHDALLHKNGENYICRYCPRKFAAKVSLVEHSMKGHKKEGDKHMCIICFKIFGTQFKLKQHYMNHSTYRPYKCDVCLRPFKHPIHLKRHAVTHAEKTFECTICLRKYRLERTLLGHRCPGNKVTCVVCGIKFGIEKSLKDHQIAAHSPRTVSCIKQGYNLLEQHFHINSMSNINIIKSNSKKKYQCTKCKMVFTVLENFKRHLCMQCVKKNYCVMCQRMFHTKQDWVRHVKLKHKNADLRCKFCGLICRTSNGLRTHFVKYHLEMTEELAGTKRSRKSEGKTELNAQLKDTNTAYKTAIIENDGILRIVKIDEIDLENNAAGKSENGFIQGGRLFMNK